MEPVFVEADAALLQHLESGDNFRRISECDMGSALELQDSMLVMILQDICVFQHYSGNGAINPAVLDSEFWETLDLSTVKIIFVSNGAYIYENTGCNDLGSTVEHQQLMSDYDQYAGYMQEMFVVGNVVALEASDPAQDWISQQMIKSHVRVLQDMLKFTDVQIKHGLENLRRRGEEINFMSLLDTLILTEDAVVNVYVGTRKYAFSADVKLVLHECFDRYQREPTMQEFDEEWNRIKGTGIEHLINVANMERTRADRAQVEKLEAMRQTNTAMEDRNNAQQMMNAAIEEIIQAQNREGMLVDRSQRAEEEKRRAEEEKRRAEEEKRRAEEEKRRAEEEKRRAEEEKRRAEEEKRRAEEEVVERKKREQLLEEEKRRAEEEKRRAEEEKRRAEEEVVETKKREQLLEEEKRRAEEEKRRAEEEKRRAEEEKRRAEEEKRRAEEEVVETKKREQLLEEDKRRAEEEVVERKKREQLLEKEKRRAEEEVVERKKREQRLEEELAREKMREKIRAELYEQEKRKFEEEKAIMAAQFEEERRTLLLRIQQISGCAQA